MTTEVNIKQTDFLDIYLNLENGEFKPHRKDNQVPLYIHAHSNHPKSIKKNLPQMVSDRISNLSSSAEIYESEKVTYENALRSVGYDHKLVFKKLDERKKRNKKRQIIWFNPPNSETNVGGNKILL